MKLNYIVIAIFILSALVHIRCLFILRRQRKSQPVQVIFFSPRTTTPSVEDKPKTRKYTPPLKNTTSSAKVYKKKATKKVAKKVAK